MLNLLLESNGLHPNWPLEVRYLRTMPALLQKRTCACPGAASNNAANQKANLNLGKGILEDPINYCLVGYLSALVEGTWGYQFHPTSMVGHLVRKDAAIPAWWSNERGGLLASLARGAQSSLCLVPKTTSSSIAECLGSATLSSSPLSAQTFSHPRFGGKRIALPLMSFAF